MLKCHDCPQPGNKIYKDGLCELHWKFHYAGMTNHERMKEKKRQRTIRRQYAKAI
jgi:hypothetical protein